MDVSIATPDGVVFKGQANDLLLHTFEGQINILENHANMVTTVVEGSVLLKGSGVNKSFELHKGVLKVEDGSVSILVDGATEQ
jgi:F-type H+-transporting ATPase subunit epsilon